MKTKPYLVTFYLIISLFTLFILSSCSEKDSETLTPDRDAGETTAATLAVATGGIMDQISDLREFMVYDTTRVGKALEEKYADRYVTIQKTYDNNLGQWNITFEKLRGTFGAVPFAYIMRQYTLKYRNENGYAQKYYVTGMDTARTVIFNLVQADGQFKTRRISHLLDSLSFNWTVSNAHQSLVTLNGTYYKAGVDTIRGWNRVRTSDHQLQLTLSNIVIPRGVNATFYQAVSGTITGSFDALITFLSGTEYSETTVHRDILILLGGGRGDITIGGKHYNADLYLGELLD